MTANEISIKRPIDVKEDNIKSFMRALVSGYLNSNIAFHLTLDVRKCYATPVIRHMTYIPSYRERSGNVPWRL